MKRIIPFLLAFATASAFAQRISHHRYLEAGIMVGLVNYSGDVAENPIEIGETRLASGVFARYHCSSRLAFKAHLFTGNISGSDENAHNRELQERSIQFKSNLLEFSLVGEWNVFNIKPEERNGIRNLKIVPYLYGGIGGVLMHPEATYYGPLDAFDKHVKYPLPEKGLSETAIIIPAGGGLRAQITNRITLGIEGGMRMVFSDNLDGISQNGSPGNNDWFYTAATTLSFMF